MKSSLVNTRILRSLAAASFALVVAACGGADSAEDAVANASALDTLTASRSPVAAPKPPTGPGKSSNSTPPSKQPATLTVSWSAPTTSADGSPLSDLAGYRVLVGTVSGAYSTAYTVNDPAATSYQVADLVPGTYYAVVKAFDTSANEGPPSAETSKTIR